MTPLRLLGALLGGAVFLWIFQRFRHGRARRFDFALVALLSLGLTAVAVDPGLVTFLRDLLALENEQFSRLIALLILSNAFLWALLIYTRLRMSDRNDQFDRLVRQLGVAEFARLHPSGSLASIVVVIPAYDEEESIGAVLAEMPAQVCGRAMSPLVVDDGSGDGTLEAARAAGSAVVRSPINRGGGAALRLGFDIAQTHGAEIIVTMDADGQHVPSEIERLVAPILEGDADFVIGSRILGEREKDSPVRYAGILVFNAVLRLLTPLRVTDCSSGFRAFRASELRRVILRQDQFHTSELLIEAARKGIRIREVPITVRRRIAGSSKKGRNLTYGLSFARTILKTWWR